jgi:hypothetical protein
MARAGKGGWSCHIGQRLRYRAARINACPDVLPGHGLEKECEMPRYLVVHPLGKEVTEEATEPISRALKAALTADAYWIKSQYAQEEGKAYCEWDAKDPASIQAVIDKAAPGLPTEGIYEITISLYSEDYR